MAAIFHEDIASVDQLRKALDGLADSFGKLLVESKATMKSLQDETQKASKISAEHVTAIKNEKDRHNELAEALKKIQKAHQDNEKAVARDTAQRQKNIQKLMEANTAAQMEARSIEEMRKKVSALTLLWSKADMGSAKFKELEANLKKTTAELLKQEQAVGKSQRNVGNYGSVWSTVGGIIAKASGIIASAYGVIRVGNEIINSAQGLTDKWQESVTGLKFGLQELFKTIATGDWSNFMTNIEGAIKAGREYAQILDDLGDRKRALSIREADTRVEIEKLERVTKNVLATDEERIAAAIKINELERQIADDRKINAEKAYKAEVIRLSSLSQLSEEQLVNFLKEYDRTEALRQEAELYNKALKEREALQNKISVSPEGVVMPSEDVSGSLSKNIEIINNTSDAAIKYAQILRGVGKTTDQELDDLTQKIVEVSGVELGYLQQTEKNTIRISTLQKSINDEKLKGVETVKKGITEEQKAEDARFEAIKKHAQEQGALYTKLSAERVKDEGDAYKLSKELGLTSYQEVYDYELGLITNSTAYRILLEGKTADEVLAIWKQASDKAAEAAKKFKVSGLPDEGGEMASLVGTMPDFTGGVKINPSDVLQPDAWKETFDTINEYAQLFGGAISDVLRMISEANQRELQQEMDAVAQKYESETALLDEQLRNKTISESQYNARKYAAEQKRKSDEAKLQKEYAKKQRDVQLTQAIVNTALAVTSALTTQPFILGVILAVVAAALGAVEIATISSQQFAKGGHMKLGEKGSVLKGKRHSQGGVDLGEVGRAEQGEYMGIINRQSTRKYEDTLPLIFDSLNKQNFEDVFAHPKLMVTVDSTYSKKMYKEMIKQKPVETKVIMTDKMMITQMGNHTIRTYL